MAEYTKVTLDEHEMPTQWYNVIPDLPEAPPPVLHPGTHEPVGPDDLAEPATATQTLQQAIRRLALGKDIFQCARANGARRKRIGDRHGGSLQESSFAKHGG